MMMMSEDEYRHIQRVAAEYGPIIRHAQREAAKRDAPAHHLPLYSYLPPPAHPREWQSPHNAEIDERPRRRIGFAPWS